MGFQVVVHHVGWCFCQDFQCDVQTAAEIGNKDFDFGIRAGFADGFDAVGEVLGAAISQVVTVDGSDHDIAQVHGFDGFGQVFRLVRSPTYWGGHGQRRRTGSGRVQISPMIMNVAVPLVKHSLILGQDASSHTVCIFCSRRMFLISKNFLPGNLARIHSGFFNFCSNGTTLIGIRAVLSAPF